MLKRFSTFINELVIQTPIKLKKKNLDGKIVVSFRGKVWLLEDNDDLDETKSALTQIGTAISNYYKKGNVVWVKDLSDLEWLPEKYPDVIIGKIEDNHLEITSPYMRHSANSVDMKKLLKTLDLEALRVSYTNNITDDTIDFEEKPSDIFYHATNIKYMRSIIKKGLLPRQYTDAPSSYEDIEHYDKIFLTTKLDNVYYQALTQLHSIGNFPVILELSVPDKTKLVVDYDLAVDFMLDHPETDRLGYKEIYYDVNRGVKNLFNADKPSIEMKNIQHRLGIFGYMGRIAPSFIKWVYINRDAYREYALQEVIGGDDDIDIGLMKDWVKLSLYELLEFMIIVEDELNTDYDEEYDDQ
jgi:hypothetical protein